MTNQTNNTNQTKTVNEDKYFNLMTTGYGFLNRVRIVTPRTGGQPYMAVACAINNGKVDADGKCPKCYIDTIVRGEQAKRVVQYLLDNNLTDSTVQAQITIGDIAPILWEKDGEPQAGLKGRLVALANVKVNGQLLTLEAEKSPDQPTEKPRMRAAS